MVAYSTSISENAGRRYPTNGVDYPIRFFNMLNFDRPRTMNEVFKWCIRLTESHGLFDRIIDTMARYPVTQIRVTNDIGKDKSYWSNHLNDKMNIPNELVHNGKDLYTFGNCVVSIVPPFKRYLVCPKCNRYLQHCINDDGSEDRKLNWKFTNYKFVAKCNHKDDEGKSCPYHGVMEVKDEFYTGKEFADRVTIQRWPILNIKVRDLPIAGKKKIYYKLEEKYKKPILSGDRFVVANVPYTFILACKQNGHGPVIELPSDLTFHYKYETITEPESEGLAKPFFFSAWKDIFMSFVLRKAQECIASDHLIPNRFLFPTTTPGGKDPLSQLNGSDWVGIITTQIKRQQNDPNEFGIVPFPVGYQAIGGQGKAMSLREEIEMQDRRIITQMGIPPELIYGGMTYSGGNVALRMLENLFVYYINKHNKFINFYCNYVASMSDINAPDKVELLPFRMADDIQQMQFLSALGAQGRISETTALSPIGKSGINLQQEATQAENDLDAMQRIFTARQKAQALAQLAISKDTTLGQNDIQGASALQQGNMNATIQSGAALVDGFVGNTTQGFINKLNAMTNIQERQNALRMLQAQDPSKYNEVISKMSGMNNITPLPEVRPQTGTPDKVTL